VLDASGFEGKPMTMCQFVERMVPALNWLVRARAPLGSFSNIDQWGCRRQGQSKENEGLSKAAKTLQVRKAQHLLTKPRKSNNVGLVSIFKMIKHLRSGIGFLAAASTFALVGVTPAKAIPDTCPLMGVTLASFGPNPCYQNDYLFTLGTYTGFLSTDIISFITTNNIIGQGFSYQIQSTNFFDPAGTSLNYTLAAPPGKEFSQYRATIASSSGVNNGMFSTVGAFGTATNTLTNDNSTGIPYNLPIRTTTDTFTGNLSAGNSQVMSVGGTVFSQPIPVVAAPSPLPILGAGAAFGFSRKLRRRIKLAA
jgi:hypothetical protein